MWILHVLSRWIISACVYSTCALNICSVGAELVSTLLEMHIQGDGWGCVHGLIQNECKVSHPNAKPDSLTPPPFVLKVYYLLKVASVIWKLDNFWNIWRRSIYNLGAVNEMSSQAKNPAWHLRFLLWWVMRTTRIQDKEVACGIRAAVCIWFLSKCHLREFFFFFSGLLIRDRDFGNKLAQNMLKTHWIDLNSWTIKCQLNVDLKMQIQDHPVDHESHEN